MAKKTASDAKRKILANQILDSLVKRVETDLAKNPNDKKLVYYKSAMNTLVKKKNVSYKDLMSLFPFFHDTGAAFFTASSSELKAIASYYNIVLPILEKAKIYQHFDYMLLDDNLMRKNSIGYLTEQEVYDALDERGFKNLSSLNHDQAREMLARHFAFTHLIQNYARSHATSRKKEGVDPAAEYEMDELDIGAAVGMITLARALDVKG